MPITAEQLEQRRHHIGSSDAAAILGVDPWQSARDVYETKVRRLDDDTSDAAELGNVLEPLVLDWARRRLGKPIRENVRVVSDDGVLACNLDGLTDDGEIVEAKTHAIASPGDPREWGDPFTDEVPYRVIVQTHHQMHVTGAVVAWVPVLIGQVGFRLYRIDRNEQAAEIVGDRCRAFWTEHVVPRLPPPQQVPPSIDLLKRIQRTPDSVVPVDDDIVEQWSAAKAARLSAEKTEEWWKAKLIAALGDAEAGRCSSGLVTYYQSVRRSPPRPAQTSVFRTLRLKGNK